MKYVLGLDFGTSSLKAVVMTEGGKVAATVSRIYSNQATAEGWVEQDVSDWTDAALHCFSELSNTHDIDLGDVVCVCPTGMHRTLVLLNKDGASLRKAMIWNDMRSEPQVRQAMAKAGKQIEEITKTRLIPATTLPRILWLKENEPKIWAETETFLYPANYFAWFLTGHIAMDRNNASASSIYDISAHSWSDELIDIFDLGADKFPPLLGSLDVQGTVSEKAARLTGLKPGVAVLSGCGDAAAELFSAGIQDSGVCKIRLGSAGDTSFLISEEEMPAHKRAAVFDYVWLGTYVDANYFLTCAQAVKWAGGLFFSELEDGPAKFDKMDKEGALSPAGARGILFHPFLLGENAPYLDPDIRAMFHGLSMGHVRGDVVRSVYEGTAYCFRNIMEKSGLWNSIHTLITVGGGTKSNLWMSVIADVIQKKCVTPEYCDAAYGAALMAGEGAGLWKTQERRAVETESVHAIVPNMENAELYDAQFARFVQIAEANLSEKGGKHG